MSSMKQPWESWVLSQTDAEAIAGVARVQSLWGGYGELLRVQFPDRPSAILKRVLPPPPDDSSTSDRRKRHSYRVELAWYRNGAPLCQERCRVAKLLGWQTEGEQMMLLLEDLQASGFAPARPPDSEQREAGICWLANFHARFLRQVPEGLWQQGGYWHLETRPDEWNRMPSSPWKTHAVAIDTALRSARYQTLIHGDSKPANFLWDAHGNAAAVDFQYVGQGCGIRDVAYFLDCCFGESLDDELLQVWLNLYFQTLRKAVDSDIDDLEAEWRALFPAAWSDYQRFYLGWSGSARMGTWSHSQLDQALTLL